MKSRASQEVTINLPKLERFVELMRDKLTKLDFEKKHLVLDMLNIKVWLDGYNVEVIGGLPILDDVNVTMQSRLHSYNIPQFPFSIPVSK